MPTNPEPAWEGDPADVQKVDAAPDALCNLRFSPSVITGVLLRVLEAHFADPDNIRDEKLRSYIWSDDLPSGTTVESRILIAPLFKYNARQLQQRPAVLVFRQALSTDRISLGHKTLTSRQANGNFEGERYVVPLRGRHVLRCIAKGAFAADRLGEEIFFRLLEFFPAIKQEFPFSELSFPQMNPPVKLDEDNENFMVDIAVDWIHLYGWTLVPIAPILKKVLFSDVVFDA